eukprot:m.31010 g.31010  ORF g.31010 m.31010 type:complete len:509 (-) comp10663_c0_seq2:414-1940(-)
MASAFTVPLSVLKVTASVFGIMTVAISGLIWRARVLNRTIAALQEEKQNLRREVQETITNAQGREHELRKFSNCHLSPHEIMGFRISNLEFLDRRWTPSPENAQPPGPRIPWKLSGPGCTLASANDWFAEYPRVVVMGPFNMGKSSLIGWLSDNVRNLGSHDIHTKGLNFYLEPIGGTPHLFIDTEGLFQPLDSENPFFKQEILTQFIKKACNCLIFVTDRMTTQDIKLLGQVKQIFGCKPQMRLIIIHNLKSVKSEESLLAYKETIRSMMPCTTVEGCKFSLRETVKAHDKCEYGVQHFFLGDRAYLDKAIEDAGVWKSIRGLISGCQFSKTAFDKPLCDSVKDVFARYFDSDVSLQWTDDELNIVDTDIQPILAKRHGEFGTLLENRLSLSCAFDPADLANETNRNAIMTVIVDAGGVLPNDISMRLPDVHTICVTAMKHYFRQERPSEVFQPIEVPFELRRDPEALTFMNEHKGVFDNNIVYFKVLLNCSRDEVKSKTDEYLRWG